MRPLGRVRHRNGLKGTVPAVPTCQEPQDLPGKGLRLAAGPAACRVLPCALSQELLQGFDNGPQGMGRLCDRGGRAVEGVGVISALLSEVRRDRGTFDMEDPGVHHFAVNLHHHLVVLPIDHILCKSKD